MRWGHCGLPYGLAGHEPPGGEASDPQVPAVHPEVLNMHDPSHDRVPLWNIWLTQVSPWAGSHQSQAAPPVPQALLSVPGLQGLLPGEQHPLVQ